MPTEDGGADADDKVIGGDELLAEEMAAALDLHLVLDVQAGDAGSVLFIIGLASLT